MSILKWSNYGCIGRLKKRWTTHLVAGILILIISRRIKMKFQSNIHVLSFLRTFVNAASIVVFGVGLVVMLGWIMDIPTFRSIVPGLPAMRFNTALSFLLMGSSIWLLQNEEASPAKKYVGKILAGLALLISLLTLSEYLFG